MNERASTFLMFEGRAEEALALYRAAFPAAEVGAVQRHGDGPAQGQILRAELTIAGHALALFDSPAHHAFTFTPSVSLFIDCADEAVFDQRFALLSAGGGVLMAPASYGFSRKFTWIQDRFGVSWQLNLP